MLSIGGEIMLSSTVFSFPRRLANFLAVAPQRIGSNMQAKQSTLGILTGNPAKGEQSQQSTIDGQESSTISKDNDKELELVHR